MALIEFEDLPSTNTPLNATNLNNNFNELNNKINDKNIITATFTTNHTCSSSNAEKIALNSSTVEGSKLTLNTSDNSITVGAGVSKVKVSCQVNFQTISSGEKILEIRVGTNSIVNNTSSMSSRTTLVINPVLTNVQQGDKIYLYVAGASGDVLRRNMGFSNITVEVVK